MSASVLVFERSATVCAESSLEPMLAALSHRGDRVWHGVSEQFVCSAHRDFSRLRPEISSSKSRSGRWRCFVEGRIDEWPQASGSPAAGASSPAARMVERFERLGVDGLVGLIGSFAGALVNVESRQVVLFRDPLGNRSLSYHLDDARLVVASEDAAVLSLEGVSDELDPARVAQFFALQELTGARTFFGAVKTLLPGHALIVGTDRVREERFYSLPDETPSHGVDPLEYAEEFRRLLDLSVAARLGGAAAPAVLLSGGLDSGPVAASSRSGLGERRLLSISWIFPRHPACDERRYVQDVRRHLALDALEVDCDDAWPLADPPSWPVHPTTPEQDAYREFHQRSYAAAGAAGVDLLFTGMFGDHLYTDTGGWLLDKLISGMGVRDRVTTLRTALGHVESLRHFARTMLGSWRSLRGTRATGPPPSWLTDDALDRLPRESAWPSPSSRRRRPLQFLRAFELLHGHGMAVERYYAGRAGLRLAYPFRDQRLVEFLLQVPTSQLLEGSVRRPIVRNAFVGRLPDSVLRRQTKTSFEPVLRQAFAGEGGRRIERLLHEHSGWRSWVRPEAVMRRDGEALSSRQIMLTWLCVCWTLWSKTRGSDGYSQIAV